MTGAERGLERAERLSDADLLARARSDVEAFALFYRRHADWVLRFAARRTRSAEHSADLAAEVFAAAFLSAERFRSARPTGEANQWLFGILLHKLAGFERRGAVERRARERLRLQTPTMSQLDFDRYVSQDGDDRGILGALERLPRDQRDAVRARVIEELPYEQVAARLQISSASARKRVSRGLATLRTELGKEAS
jgi:RNA polymerase sigma factor (sigma-70 family)